MNEQLQDAWAGVGTNNVKCDRGHTANRWLLTGQGNFEHAAPDSLLESTVRQSVVLIGLYDDKLATNKIRKLGSGFIVDGKKGLIVTAARTLMRIAGQERFGQNYFGIVGAKIVVAVAFGDNDDPAVFRYFAKIWAKDPAISDPDKPFCRVDACVLKLTSRFEMDVGGNGDGCHDEIEILLRDNSALLNAQQLVPLPISPTSMLEESVRIFGFEQGDDTVNRSMNSSRGYICQHRVENHVDQEPYRYRPPIRTIVMSRGKTGHTGGPCVNEQGEVIGLFSCADPLEKDTRSFVVPVSEWQDLLQLPTDQV